jgi:hypothetical protein
VLALGALGAAIAFVATRDERMATPTSAAVAGTATVRRAATHPPATATHSPATRHAKGATPTGFVPSRVFAWPAVAGASRYQIRFYRGRRLILQARSQRSRFVLPAALHLSPGRYRWVVIPHVRGSFRRAVVDSRFSIRSG